MVRIKEVTAQVAQIATAAEQQSASSEEINRNIEVIANVATEADEGASQTAQATRELAELAQSLLALAGVFADRHVENVKLRESSGKMKGILPKLMHDDRLRRTFHDQPISRLAFPQFRFLAAVSRQVSGQQHVQQQSGDTDKKGTFPC